MIKYVMILQVGCLPGRVKCKAGMQDVADQVHDTTVGVWIVVTVLVSPWRNHVWLSGYKPALRTESSKLSNFANGFTTVKTIQSFRLNWILRYDSFFHNLWTCRITSSARTRSLCACERRSYMVVAFIRVKPSFNICQHNDCSRQKLRTRTKCLRSK